MSKRGTVRKFHFHAKAHLSHAEKLRQAKLRLHFALLGFISFLPPSSLHNTTMRAIKSCASTTATTNKLLFLCRIGREYEKTNLRLNVDSSVKKRKISSNILKIFLQFVNFIQTCELLKRFWKSSWNSLNFRFIPKVNESSTRRKNFANRAQ